MLGVSADAHESSRRQNTTPVSIPVIQISPTASANVSAIPADHAFHPHPGRAADESCIRHGANDCIEGVGWICMSASTKPTIGAVAREAPPLRLAPIVRV
jgi:hypothetical protein